MAVDTTTIKGSKKAAILLVTLGEELTTQVFQHLDEDEISNISQEIATLDSVRSEEANQVIEEFHNLAKAREYMSRGGLDYAKKVLVKSLGPDEATRVIDRLTKTVESTAGFSALSKVDPQQLSKFIMTEHPQTIALVLAHLDFTQAAECINSLPEDIQADVITRMAKLDEVSPDVIKRISEVLDQKLASMSYIGVSELGGLRAVAEIFNRMNRTVGSHALEEIQKNDPELATQIKDLMFVFEDILDLNDKDIQEILKRTDKRVLTVALKGTTEEMKSRFFKNMSSRASDSLKEEMNYMGAIRLRDVEKAQHEIVNVVRQLEDEGTISRAGEQGDELVS